MKSKLNRILAAVMFSDLEGFTALMGSNETLALQKLDKFLTLNKKLHKKHGGEIVNFLGDGTLSIFTSAYSAVKCAAELQRQLQAPIKVPLRIGIEMGDIVYTDDNVYGNAVNLASRIESFSVPGAVLVSDTIFQQLKNHTTFNFKALGEYHFKNIAKPSNIYALDIDGLVAPEASELVGKGKNILKLVDNLPQTPDTFLGRETEIKEIDQLLNNHRMITLTGPGGTGKTRLAIELARIVGSRFPDGVYWIPLASIKEVEVVPLTIAKYLKLEEDAILSVEEQIQLFFELKKALLILDNFEQVVGATSIINFLLEQCGQLQVLVTSRVLLELLGEIEYPVQPLETPKQYHSKTLKELEKMSSLALFVERATLSSRNFELTNENVITVAELCVRLDGLPLAIELAAARIKIFSPLQLLTRLRDSFDILKGGGQYPTRHQTLRQTIAWSYDLLEKEQQQLLRRASIFVGGSTIEALEKICGSHGLEQWNTVEGIMGLVNKSLLHIDETGKEIRLVMLETIREFALEEFEKTEEVLKVKSAHINYYLSLSELAAPHFYDAEAENWEELIFNDQENFRAAVDYSLDSNQIDMAYRLGLSLIPFWGYRGMTANEGVQQLEKIAAVAFDESLHVQRLKILQTLARYYGYTPFRNKALPIFEECLAYWRIHANENQIGLVLNDFGWYYIEDGFDYQKAVEYSLEAKKIFVKTNNPSRLVASLNNIGMAHMFRGRPKDAMPLFKETSKLTGQLEDKRRNAQALLNTAYCNYLFGNYEIAEEQLEESLLIFRKSSSRILEEFALIILCFVKYENSEFEKCRHLSIESHKIAKETRTSFAIGLSLICRAEAEFGMGNLEEAENYIDKALNIFDSIIKMKPWINRGLICKAKIALKKGDLQEVGTCCIKLFYNELEQGNYSGFIPGLEFAATIVTAKGDFEISARLFYGAQGLRSHLNTPVRKSDLKIYDKLIEIFESNLSAKTLVNIRKEKNDPIALKNLAIDILSTEH